MSTNPLQALIQQFESEMRAVDQCIEKRMQSHVGMIPDLAGHLVSAGGKRVRPLLSIACADLVGYKGDHHISLAASVEFIHSATLLHDDVVDESALRRGRKTANSIWGNQSSVLVGDFLFSRAFELMVTCGSMRVLEILSSASSTIAEGEILQLANIGNIDLSFDTYIEIIHGKTAALFAAACEAPAALAGVDPEVAAALNTYGTHLGIAFQIADDALDYAADTAAIGKTIGDDFREGKMTLPVLLAIKDGDTDQRSFFEKAITRGVPDAKDLEKAVAIISDNGYASESLGIARDHALRAKEALISFPEGKTRESLTQLVDFCVERSS